MNTTYKTVNGETVNLTSAPRYGSCGVRATYAAARDVDGKVWKSLGFYPAKNETLVSPAGKYDFE